MTCWHTAGGGGSCGKRADSDGGSRQQRQRHACLEVAGVGSCFNYQLMAATARPCLPTLPAAAMVGDSWMGKHFEVVGDRSTHYGKFAR